ncbi:MAG: universal stress protein E [Enterobacterales bacterium]|jgi:universal stress protein E
MRKILVIANKDNGPQLAFQHGLEIARNTAASIEFVGFVHTAGVDSSDILTDEQKRKIRNSYMDEKNSEIDDYLGTIDLNGINVNTDVVWEKSLEQWVVARCNQKSFDMVFKSGNRSESFLYTPSDWQLMRNCPVPIMIVGDNHWKDGGIVLAALDLSTSSERNLALNESIIRNTLKFAEATDSIVHACYSMAISKVLTRLDSIDHLAYEEKMKEKIDPLIRKLIDDTSLDRSRLHIASGNPSSEITRISQEIEADAVVLGNKSSRSVRGRLLGNTAENVLHHISADVIVVK